MSKKAAGPPAKPNGKNRKSESELFTPRVIVFAMIILMAVLAEIFFATWCGVQCRRTGYEIVQARTEGEKLSELQKKLKIERVRLMSPQVLGHYARQELNLTTPEPDQIVIVP